MSNQSLSQVLDLVEQQFNEVSVIVAQGQPDSLPATAATLQQLTVELLRLVEASRAVDRPATLLQRVKVLFESMSVLRTTLMRRMAMVDQSLKIIVPGAPDATYAEGGTGTYGSVPRGSGAFKVVAA
jgi:hypothetical protein